MIFLTVARGYAFLPSAMVEAFIERDAPIQMCCESCLSTTHCASVLTELRQVVQARQACVGQPIGKSDGTV